MESTEIKVKVYKPDLKVPKQAGGYLTGEDEKEKDGGYVALNADDDDQSGVIDKDKKSPPKNEKDLIKIILDEKGPDSKKGVYLTVKGGDKIRIWEAAAKAGEEIKEEVKLGKDGKTKTFTKLPQELWVEGYVPSASPRDVELALGSDDVTCQDKVKLTVIAINLDADLNIDGAIDPSDTPLKAKRGAYVVVNNDDDDRNGTVDYDDKIGSADEKELKKLKVLPLKPKDLLVKGNGKVVLSRSKGTVRVYSSKLKGEDNNVLWSLDTTGGLGYDKDVEGNGKKTWDLSIKKDRDAFESIVKDGLWMEGRGKSSDLRDTQLTISYIPAVSYTPVGPVEPIRCDWMNVTVVLFQGIEATIEATPPNTTRLGNGPVAPDIFVNATDTTPRIVYYLHEPPPGLEPGKKRDSTFEMGRALMLVQGSLDRVPLKVTRAPEAVDVRWSVERSPDDADELGKDKTAVDPGPSPETRMATDKAGSFLVTCYVDVNGNGRFDEGEPRIILPVVLIRVKGVENASAAHPANTKILRDKDSCFVPPPNPPPIVTALTGVSACTGDFGSAATAGVHNIAKIEVVGGGNDGMRGLNQLFGGWVNNITRYDTAANYVDGRGTVRSQKHVFVQAPIHLPPDPGLTFFVTRPPKHPDPHVIVTNLLTIAELPLLDTSIFPNQDEGTGGNTARRYGRGP